MKKIYIAPAVKCYELGPETPMMAGIDSAKTTSGFGTTTNSTDNRSAGWQVDWDAADAEEVED